VSLTRVHDTTCTVCHRDLKTHGKRGADTPFRDVRDFPDGHPEFALWGDPAANKPAATDPSQLRFNHKKHLNPDGVFVLGPLGPDDKVPRKVLDCADCHQPDTAGRYMKPIRYDAHCASCHPLSVRLAGDFKGEQLERAAEEFAALPVPHGVPPAQVRAVLRERLVAFAQKNKVTEKAPDPERLFPVPPRPPDVSEAEWKWAEGERQALEPRVFSNKQLPVVEAGQLQRAAGCVFCHIEDPNAPRKDDLPVFLPTEMPDRWLKHAQFSHQSHRNMKCEDCHLARDSERTEQILLPSIRPRPLPEGAPAPTTKGCAECHSRTGGVRHDCVACHQYHDRSKLHGR
jgi:hypothetical protein